MNIKRRFHTDELVGWVYHRPNICYSDSGLTAAEQSAMDADKAAEVEEETPAAPTPETPADETAPAADPGAEQPQRQGMVPHAALHEERTKRQDTERQLADERKRSATLEERTNLMLQRLAQPQPQQPAPQQQMPEIPAFDADPAGHILGQVRQQGAILGELVQAVTGQHRQAEANNGVQQLTMRAAAMERDFAAANPDYDKASGHLFDMRRQELVVAGWTDPGEIQHMMANEATGLAARAMQLGKNPAEVVYALAKLRGYVAAAPEVDNGPAAGEGQLRTIAAGQQQSRSVGNLRGTGPAPLTAQRLAEMSDADFSKMMDTPEGRALMGS